MPELPEIEVTRQGISPHIVGNIITSITIHSALLRCPISSELTSLLPGQVIEAVERRGKYLISVGKFPAPWGDSNIN